MSTITETPRRLRRGRSKGIERSRGQRAIAQIAFVVGAIAVWELVALSGLLPPALLPRVGPVLIALLELLVTAEFWAAVGMTLGGAMLGLLISAAIAIPIGLVAGTATFIERSIRILVDLGRSFPSIALLPVIMLFYGTTMPTKLIAIVLACVFPLIVQTLYGARAIEHSIIETSRSYRIRFGYYFLRVALPTATPSIMTGLRLAATIAVLVSVGVEIVGGLPGIGSGLSRAQLDGATPIAFAYFIVAGNLGYLVTRVAEIAEERFLRWRASTND
ncbi:MAG: ABC transporter permease [Microbacterium sp.]|uniref:ABC transporter permease n=1 Tax=Microbacterium sp. TaxID=51671 RepID=UPI003A8377B8